MTSKSQENSKADSKNRHRRTRYRHLRNLQKPDVIQCKSAEATILDTKKAGSKACPRHGLGQNALVFSTPGAGKLTGIQDTVTVPILRLGQRPAPARPASFER
jgi:hypothetical protein